MAEVSMRSASLRSSASARLAWRSAASVAPEARYAAARLAHARPSWYLSVVSVSARHASYASARHSCRHSTSCSRRHRSTWQGVTSSSRLLSFARGARHTFRDLLQPPLAPSLLPPPSSRPRRSTRKVRWRTAASLVPTRRFGSAQGASPAFEPEPAVPSGQPSRRRRRRLTPHNHAVPVVINPLRARLAHRPTAESSPTRSSSSVSCADLVDFPARREPQPHSQPGRARARPSPSRMPYY